jgi:hypothetical protein
LKLVLVPNKTNKVEWPSAALLAAASLKLVLVPNKTNKVEWPSAALLAAASLKHMNLTTDRAEAARRPSAALLAAASLKRRGGGGFHRASERGLPRLC